MALFRSRTAMNTGKNRLSQSANNPRPAADDWLHSIPVPEAHEGGDSLWATWHEESQRVDLAFADTQPSEPISLAGEAVDRRPRQHLDGRWTTEGVLALARRNNRVCPRPPLWSTLHVLIEGDHYADLQPPPVQPWLWTKLSNLQRRLQFREYIEWADRHGQLEAMGKYLQSLAEADWVHMGEG